MNRAGFLLLIFFVASEWSVAQATPEEKVLALERAWNQAVKQKDGQAAASLLGDELVYIEYDGTVMDKKRYVAAMHSTSLHAEQVTNESMKVQVHGKSAIVVGVYLEKGTTRGKSYLHRERFVDTWVNRGSAWVCVSSQSTLITH
jgi:ketosteroid isomerase-like protein